MQYFDWLWHAVRGDLGKSLLHKYERDGRRSGRRLPVTLYLGLIAFAIGCVVGPLLGVISAVRRGKWIDNLVTVIANLGITAPPFWLGAVMIYVFGLYLGLLPIYGYTSPLVDFWKNLRQSIMPIFVLATFPIASAARQTSSSVIEVMQQDYVRTAWAKGLERKGHHHPPCPQERPHAGRHPPGYVASEHHRRLGPGRNGLRHSGHGEARRRCACSPRTMPSSRGSSSSSP